MAKLTVEKVREWAIKNYNKGGDVIVECWEDSDIQEFIDEGGTITKLKSLARTWNERHCQGLW